MSESRTQRPTVASTSPVAGAPGFRGINRNVVLFSIAVLFLFCVQTVSVLGTARALNRYQDAAEIQAFLLRLSNFISLASGVVAGQRGYAITGDDLYLERYREAVAQVDTELKQLLMAADRYPLRKRYLDFLEQDVLALIAVLDDAIEAQRAQPQHAVVSTPLLDEGRRLMTRILDTTALLSGAEKTRFDEQSTRVATGIHFVNMTVVVGTLLSLIAGGAGIYLLAVAARRQHRDQSLQAAKERAEFANQEKSRFLANLSHEIRSPLNAILGFSEILRQMVSNPKERRYVDTIVSNSESLVTLINDVLDLAKIEAGKLKLRPELTDLRALSRSWKTMFAQQVGQKNKDIEIRVYVDESVPEHVMVDRVRLQQIAMNLVGNAIKFTDRGHVHVRLWSEPAEDPQRCTLRLTVEDSGAGIPADRLEKIFKPFDQAGLMLDKEQEGAGLGLSIVRSLVRVMKGTIEVDSEVGRGSRFVVTFAKLRMGVPASDAVEAREEGNFLPPLKILIADDNAYNRELLSAILEPGGHRLLYAENGQQAIEIARAENPDLVLMDIRMPVVDGNMARDALSTEPASRGIPVIAVTASALADEAQDLRRNFDGFVHKPFTRTQLLHEMARVLRGAPPEAAPATAIDEESGEVVRADLLEGWRTLLEHLRGNLDARVHDLRAAMTIGEISDFAWELQRLGEAADCPRVVRYAERLAAYAEGFELAALERTLAGFPAVIADIEAAIAQAQSP